MFVRLLTILSFYPPRVDPNAFDVEAVRNYYPTDASVRRYGVLSMNRDEDEAHDEGEDEETAWGGVDAVFPEQGERVERVDGKRLTLSRFHPDNGAMEKLHAVRALGKRIRHWQAEGSTASSTRTGDTVALAFVAASPLTRRVVEASLTEGIVYFARVAEDENGVPVEPGEAERATAVSSGSGALVRHRVLSTRVGNIERELGAVYAAKTDWEAFDPPYLGYGQDWRHHVQYRQLTVHTASLAPGSLAWRLLEASAWWWRDRRVPISNTTHPVCFSAETLEGPTAFPRELFGAEDRLRVVRLRSPFTSHPYFVSGAMLDVQALADVHGAHLTELDLYGASRSVNLTRALASGAFSALVYANLTRTTFCEELWRAAGIAGKHNVALPCLEELLLDGCQYLRQVDAVILSHTPNLRKLNLFNCINLKLVKDLAVHCPYLVQLCLCYSHIHVLDMGSHREVLADGAVVSRPAQARHLKAVNLKNSAFYSLDWLAQVPALETLLFSGFDVPEALSLADFTQARFLTKLELFCSRVDDLTALTECVSLEDLFLYGVSFGEEHRDASRLDLEPLLLAGVTARGGRPRQHLKRLKLGLSGRVRLDHRSDVNEPLLDDSDSALAASQLVSMLAQPMDSLEELDLSDSTDFDDLHTLLTLPNGRRGVADRDSVLHAPHIARFPNLKVLNVGGSEITELVSAVRYCPMLEKLTTIHCRHVNVTETIEALTAIIAEGEADMANAAQRPGSEWADLAAGEEVPPPRTDTRASEAGAAADAFAPCCRTSRRLNGTLQHLRELSCSFCTSAHKPAGEEDAWMAPLYTALSFLCPALESLKTFDRFTAFYPKRCWGDFPRFPALKHFSGGLYAVPVKRTRHKGLRPALACMFPRIESMDVDVQSQSPNAVSPFICLAEMPLFRVLDTASDAFVGAESVVADPGCPLRHLTCTELTPSLVKAIGASRRLQTLVVRERWAVANTALLEELAHQNRSVDIQLAAYDRGSAR